MQSLHHDIEDFGWACNMSSPWNHCDFCVGDLRHVEACAIRISYAVFLSVNDEDCRFQWDIGKLEAEWLYFDAQVDMHPIWEAKFAAAPETETALTEHAAVVSHCKAVDISDWCSLRKLLIHLLSLWKAGNLVDIAREREHGLHGLSGLRRVWAAAAASEHREVGRTQVSGQGSHILCKVLVGPLTLLHITEGRFAITGAVYGNDFPRKQT